MHINLSVAILWHSDTWGCGTIESWVSAYGCINVTRDFGPQDIADVCIYYIDPLKCSTLPESGHLPETL